MTKALLAIAIEDRVDLWFSCGRENNAEVKLKPRVIPEGGDYFEHIHCLLGEMLLELVQTVSPMTGHNNPLNDIAATVISTPGVVRNNQILLQLPLWHSNSASDYTVQWHHEGHKRPRTSFNFSEILASFADTFGFENWGSSERQRFKDTIFVVNDVTACAAFEHSRRRRRELDFVYTKIHDGINCGIVQRGHGDTFTIKAAHPEAGHSYPELHEYDAEAEFYGVCRPHNRGCFEGMVAAHSYVERARHGKSVVFASWKRQVEKFQLDGLQGQELDNAMLHYLLGDDSQPPAGNGEGVELVAHYVGQLAYQLAIGPLAPEQLVFGGRMAKPIVLEAIRTNIKTWSNGYPRWQELTSPGIEKFIVSSRSVSGQKHNIEIEGALTIARSRATQRHSGQLILLSGGRT